MVTNCLLGLKAAIVFFLRIVFLKGSFLKGSFAKLLVLPILAGFTITAYSAEFTAQVDRTVVTEGESLRLHLRINDLNAPGEPNVDRLRKDFDVSSPEFTSQLHSVLGQGTQGFREWRYTLLPKHLGVLTIPEISLNGLTSDAIAIKVKPMSEELKQQLSQALFFNVSITPLNPYVQSQVLYKERLYFSLPLVNHQLSPFELDNALVVPINEGRLFQAQYQGKAYQVIERSFAIFPQSSGPLILPKQTYQGEMRSGYFSRGKTMSTQTDSSVLDVQPAPANPIGESTSLDSPWLPAELLTLAAQWEGDPSQLVQGQPISLTLILSAEGLTTSQLPKLSLPKVTGIKYYQEPEQTNEEASSEGINSSKSLKIALIPTMAGEIKLPELRIPWFSTEDNTWKVAKLSFPTLKIATNPELALTADAQPTVAQPIAAQPELPSELPSSEKHKEATPKSTNAEHSEIEGSRLSNTQNDVGFIALIVAVVVLFLSNLFILYAYLKLKFKLSSKSESPQHQVSGNCKEALKTLKQAVTHNRPQEAYTACINFAEAKWRNFENESSNNEYSNKTGLYEIAEQLEDPKAIKALQDLDAVLYGYGDNWDGQAILQALTAYKERPVKQRTEDLTSLYP